MAKSKKHHATGHRTHTSKKKTGKKKSSKKMGAVALNPNSTLVKVGVPVAGYLFADTINGAIDKMNGGKIDNKIVTGVQTLGGALLVFKKKPGLLTTIIGGLLLGSGVKRGLKEFGVITGYQQVPVIGGYGKVPVIGGYTPNMSALGYTTTPRRNAIVGSVDGGGCGRDAGYRD